MSDWKSREIFLHGLGQTSSNWEKTIESFNVQINYDCPDLSEMLLGKEKNYRSLFESFQEYCEHFSEPVNICGLSLGGILALHYGIEHPRKVNSLVLIAPQYKMPRKLLVLQNIIFRFMPNSMFMSMGFSKKEFIEMSKSMMDIDFSGKLNRVTCPVLVICGEKDNVNMKAAKELAKHLPKAQFRVIEGAGHEVNSDVPEALARVLIDFYNRCNKTEGSV